MTSLVLGVEADETCKRKSCEQYGTYTLPWRCYNCGAKFKARFTKTHGASRVDCPLCEVRGGGRV